MCELVCVHKCIVYVCKCVCMCEDVCALVCENVCLCVNVLCECVSVCKYACEHVRDYYIAASKKIPLVFGCLSSSWAKHLWRIFRKTRATSFRTLGETDYALEWGRRTVADGPHTGWEPGSLCSWSGSKSLPCHLPFLQPRQATLPPWKVGFSSPNANQSCPVP